MPVILIGADKGGVGKTTISTNLAAYFTYNLKQTVFLIDAEPVKPGSKKQSGSTLWSKARKQTGLPKISMAKATGDIYDLVEDVQHRYDWVIVDTGGHDSEEIRTGLLATDFAIIPFDLSNYSAASIHHMDDVIKTASRYNSDLKACSVINNVDGKYNIKRVKSVKKQLQESDNCKPLSTVINRYSAYLDTQDFGAGVVEMNHRQSRAQVQLLGQEVVQACGVESKKGFMNFIRRAK